MVTITLIDAVSQVKQMKILLKQSASYRSIGSPKFIFLNSILGLVCYCLPHLTLLVSIGPLGCDAKIKLCTF